MLLYFSEKSPFISQHVQAENLFASAVCRCGRRSGSSPPHQYTDGPGGSIPDPLTVGVSRPGYMSRKRRNFRTDKLDTWHKRKFWLMLLGCKRLVPSRSHELQESNFRLCHVSNLSILNLPNFLLMYPGSAATKGHAPAKLGQSLGRRLAWLMTPHRERWQWTGSTLFLLLKFVRCGNSSGNPLPIPWLGCRWNSSWDYLATPSANNHVLRVLPAREIFMMFLVLKPPNRLKITGEVIFRLSVRCRCFPCIHYWTIEKHRNQIVLRLYHILLRNNDEELSKDVLQGVVPSPYWSPCISFCEVNEVIDSGISNFPLSNNAIISPFF